MLRLMNQTIKYGSKAKKRNSNFLTGYQRTAGWCEAVESFRRTDLRAAV